METKKPAEMTTPKQMPPRLSVHIAREIDGNPTVITEEFIHLKEHETILRPLVEVLEMAQKHLPEVGSLPLTVETEVGKCVKAVNAALALYRKEKP